MPVNFPDTTLCCFSQRAISSKTDEISFLREDMVRLKRNLEGQLEKANEGAERSAVSAQAASQELEERRAAMDRTRGELDECRKRLEQLGVDAVSLKKWSAVIIPMLVPSFHSANKTAGLLDCLDYMRASRDHI